MILGSTVLTAGAHVAPLAAVILGLPAYLATAFLIAVATNAAALPAAAFTIPLFPWWLMMLLYAALTAIVLRRRTRADPALVPTSKPLPL
jgi:membrane protein implicated in regulation of membrane protease activity